MRVIKQWLGRSFLSLAGWKLEIAPQFPSKFVMIAAPHTTNWDLPFMLATAWASGVSLRWLGKHTIFAPPFGGIMRGLGGMPVERSAPHNLVAQLAKTFADAERLIIAIPPEGTRSQRPHWKSGFYHVAQGAQVPIGLGFLDFAGKRCGLTEFVMPTGDIVADMDRIRAFYAPIRGKFPAFESAIRLKEEADAVAAPVPGQGIHLVPPVSSRTGAVQA